MAWRIEFDPRTYFTYPNVSQRMKTPAVLEDRCAMI